MQAGADSFGMRPPVEHMRRTQPYELAAQIWQSGRRPRLDGGPEEARQRGKRRSIQSKTHGGPLVLVFCHVIHAGRDDTIRMSLMLSYPLHVSSGLRHGHKMVSWPLRFVSSRPPDDTKYNQTESDLSTTCFRCASAIRGNRQSPDGELLNDLALTVAARENLPGHHSDPAARRAGGRSCPSGSPWTSACPYPSRKCLAAAPWLRRWRSSGPRATPPRPHRAWCG